MSTSLKLTLLFSTIILSIVLGRFASEGKWILIAGLVALVVMALSILNLEYGLMLLVFSMLLSPEYVVGAVPGRAVVIRFDDMLIFLLFIVWLVWKTYYRHEVLFVRTPILFPIFLYTLAVIISTVRGLYLGYVGFVKSFFYILKYTEYFLVYILVINIIKSRNTVLKMLIAGTITCIIVCLYGYSLFGKTDRLFAPFDYEYVGGRMIGEAGSLGGYLLITMAQALAFFCYSKSIRYSFLSLGLFIFMLPIFAYTLSRASFLGFLPMLFTIILLTAKKKLLLLLLFLLSMVLVPIVFPRPFADVKGRIKETLVGYGPPGEVEEAHVLGFNVREMSALLRIRSWRRAFTEFIPTEPLFGYGVTGVGLIDTQIPLIIGEVGLIGLLLFIFLIYSLFKMALSTFFTTKDTIFKSMSLGFVAGLIGLLFQSVAVNTFIIIRIMMPFWFLAGLISLGPYLEERTEEVCGSF